MYSVIYRNIVYKCIRCSGSNYLLHLILFHSCFSIQWKTINKRQLEQRTFHLISTTWPLSSLRYSVHLYCTKSYRMVIKTVVINCLKINRNIKKFGVLPIWKAKSNVSSVDPLSQRNIVYFSNEGPRNDKLCFPYRQYTNLFIFRFVSEHCLRSTLRLFHYIKTSYLCCKQMFLWIMVFLFSSFFMFIKQPVKNK